MTITAEEVFEYEALHQLVKSPGWRVVRNMLVSYKNSKQEEVNTFLRSGNDDKARAALSARDGASAFIDRVNEREKELSQLK